MIDHKIVIGGTDVSDSVISIKVNDQIDTSSAPGKITVVLANRKKIIPIVSQWKPQTTDIAVTISARDIDYHVAYGHLVSVSRCDPSPSQITVSAECDLGHLVDALGVDYKSGTMKSWTHDELVKVLRLHKSLNIKLHYQARVVEYSKEKNYNSETTFQEVLEDLAADVGAIYYFDEAGTLQFRDPTAVRNSTPINLDRYLLNPNETSSIIGLRNRVTVIADQTKADEEQGRETPGSEPIMATAEDEDSIDEYGILEAPTDRAIWIGTQEEAQKRADMLLNFYKMFKNAETKPLVTNMIPSLHSMVSYTAFIPIGESETAATITGAVIERSIEYDVKGLRVQLTISPGELEMESAVGDAEIKDFTLDMAEAATW